MTTQIITVQNTETEVFDLNTANDFKEMVIDKPVNKLKQFSHWINPKNWFSRFSSIEITLEEFQCKKNTK